LEESTPPSVKLAYTSTNLPIHAYNEELSRLLVALDAVESYGGKKVRRERREVVRTVEEEAGRVERLIGIVWGASTVEEVHMESGEERMEVGDAIDAFNEWTLVAEGEVAKEISPEMPTLESEHEVDVQVDTAREETRDGDETELVSDETELVSDEVSEPPSTDNIRDYAVVSHDEVSADMDILVSEQMPSDSGAVEQTREDNADMEEVEVESVLVPTDTDVEVDALRFIE
jgi:hypothetical protein